MKTASRLVPHLHPASWGLLVLVSLFFFSLPAFCRDKDAVRHACPVRPTEFGQIQKRAETSDPVAQAILANCYELGRNVKPSRPETIHWLKLAAEQGYAPAEYELGRIYLYGRGIPADYQQALVWERKAAQLGERKAQRDLAFMYERGLGVQSDAREAAVWNRKAAEQGEAQAQFHLAEALEKGLGAPANFTEAKHWYLKAARQNLPNAQLRLAQIHAHDAGQTCSASLVWYAKAAAGGETQAMYESGKLYQTRKCGGDRENAYLWFRIGGRFGSAESQAEAEKLSSQLTPAQKRTIALRVDHWIRQHSGAQKEEDENEREER
jgi:TPR repeat protein